MVGKRLKVLWRPEAGPKGLEAGLGGGAGPTGLEVGLDRAGGGGGDDRRGGACGAGVVACQEAGLLVADPPLPRRRGSLFLPRLRGAHF